MIEDLDDEALLARLKELVRRERGNAAEIVAHLAEVERRDIVLAKAYPSLYAYCVQELGYSEAAAYFRIRAARAARDFPVILPMLRSGDLHLEAIVRLYPHLTKENCDRLLATACRKTRREIDQMTAELCPQPRLPDKICFIAVRQEARPVQEDSPGPLFAQPPLAAAAPPASAELPGAAGPVVKHVRFAFTADEGLLQLVERAREVLRHKFPHGRLEDVFRDALNALLDKRDPDRRLIAKLARHSPGSTRL